MIFCKIFSSTKDHQESKSKNIGQKSLLHTDAGILTETHRSEQPNTEWEMMEMAGRWEGDG